MVAPEGGAAPLALRLRVRDGEGLRDGGGSCLGDLLGDRLTVALWVRLRDANGVRDCEPDGYPDAEREGDRDVGALVGLALLDGVGVGVGRTEGATPRGDADPDAVKVVGAGVLPRVALRVLVPAVHTMTWHGKRKTPSRQNPVWRTAG